MPAEPATLPPVEDMIPLDNTPFTFYPVNAGFVTHEGILNIVLDMHVRGGVNRVVLSEPEMNPLIDEFRERQRNR